MERHPRVPEGPDTVTEGQPTTVHERVEGTESERAFPSCPSRALETQGLSSFIAQLGSEAPRGRRCKGRKGAIAGGHKIGKDWESVGTREIGSRPRLLVLHRCRRWCRRWCSPAPPAARPSVSDMAQGAPAFQLRGLPLAGAALPRATASHHVTPHRTASHRITPPDNDKMFVSCSGGSSLLASGAARAFGSKAELFNHDTKDIPCIIGGHIGFLCGSSRIEMPGPVV